MRWHALVLTGLLATACGGPPTAPPAADPPSATDPKPPPTTPGQGVADPESPAATIARAIQAYNGLKAFVGVMDYFEKSPGKTARRTYDMAGMPPKTLRLLVREGDSQGTKLLWTGGPTVKVRAAGFLGAITVDLPLGDSKLVSGRGYRLDQTDLSSLMATMSDKRAVVKISSKSDTSVILAITGPHLLSGVVRAGIVLDAKTFLPQGVEMRDKSEIVYQVKFAKFVPVKSVSLDI